MNRLSNFARVRLALTLAAALAPFASAQTRKPPQVTSRSAAATLRHLYFTAQYNDAVALGDSLLRRFPSDSRLRAWFIANLSGAGFSNAADSVAARIDSATRDPWLLAARAFGRLAMTSRSKAAGAEAVRIARRASALAPNDEDLAWLVAQATYTSGGFTGSGAQTLAYADSALARFPRSAELHVVRAVALWQIADPFSPTGASKQDTVKRNESLRAYAAVRAMDSLNYSAHYSGGIRLAQTNPAEALALLKRAVALAPRSANARGAYWRFLNDQRGPTVAEKHAAIAADRAQFLALTDSAPWALEAALSSMRYVTKDTGAAVSAIEERLIAKAPRSTFAENVLLAQANKWRDSLYAARDTARPGPKSDSVVVRRKFIEAIEAFIRKPWVANPANRDQAVSALFFEVREDSTYPADKLLALVKRLVASQTFGAPGFRYGEGSRALSNRKIALPYAQELAREGLKHTARYINEYPGYVFTSVGEQADALDAANAGLYQHLGWAQFADGKLDEADKNLSHALELTKKNVNIYYDLGRLRAAQGREDEAELMYAQGMTVRVRGVNPNRRELARLYEKKHGSVAGWESYIAALEEKERATRKEKILAKRDSQPQIAPPFKLADLTGKVVNSDSVRGQTLVVNFWGMWCGPCVAEMPELQQFYDKYKNDKSVSILTISNDKDLAELREWMAKRKLTMPTLFDDGYVAKSAQIFAFPTTWFIDRDGKVQFRAVGNTGSLVEEWSWRLEATKNGRAIQP